MKKIIAAVLALGLCLSQHLPAAASYSGTEEYDGFIVALKDEGLMKLQTAQDSELRDLGGGYYLAGDIAEVASLVGMGAVESFEPNYKMHLQDADIRWNMEAVKAYAAWDHVSAAGEPDMRGGGVTIAVIDSGVYAEHPDLSDANILDYIDLTGNDSPVDTTHGTQVAGILAAGLRNGIGVDGAVPDVNILPIRITSRGSTSNALAIEAINTAVAMGADVINISIGGKKVNTALEEACAAAAEAGVIIVCAAGNYTSGTKSEDNHMYPASFVSTVSVSACKLSGDDILFDESYSYFNDMVDAAAPGTAITSLSIDGGVITGKGSSFSAPHVSALAVLLKQHWPDADVEDFRTALEASCIDLGEEGKDNYYGFGFIDTEAFVKYIAETAPVPPGDEPEVPPAETPDEAPVRISAEILADAVQRGESISVRTDAGEVLLSSDAVAELAGKVSNSVDIIFEATEGGYVLSFESSGEELELRAPVRLDMAWENGVPYYCAGGEKTAAAVSGAVNGRVRMIVPGSGEISFVREYSSFDDLEGHWAAANAVFVANRGIFKGDGSSFMPGEAMTRAMFATVLGRIYERSYGALETNGKDYFTDCDYGSWYGPYVDWCYEAGIVQGDGKGNFNPGEEISRAQMAAMIFRFSSFLGLDATPEGEGSFSDEVDIPRWAAEAADFCLHSGIMGGMSDGSFAAGEKATRAQCAAVIQRLIMYALA